MTLILDFQHHIFKVLKGGGLINMERKSIWCWICYVILKFDLTHELDLRFWSSVFEIAVSQEWEGQLTWSERDVSW